MDRRRRTRLGALIAGAGALVVAGALAFATGSDEPVAAAPAPPPEPVETSPAPDRGGFDVGLGDLPQGLVDDLGALRELPAGQQPGALADIRDRAADGDYGRAVQRVAGQLPDAAALVPADLRADVEALVPADWDFGLDDLGQLDLGRIDPGDPGGTLDDIRSGAREGEFGDDVQGWAQQLDAAEEWAGRLGGLFGS